MSETMEITRWSLEELGTQTWQPGTRMLDETCHINATMDVGSTSERTLLFEKDLSSMSDPLVQDSAFYQFDRSIENIRSASPSMTDNLEMVISPEDKSHFIGREVRILKGSLRRAVNDSFIPMSSNASKIDQTPTYVNIYANLGIALLYNMARMGCGYKTNRVHFTVALPTEDLDNQSRIDAFLLNLCGIVHINFPRIGVAFDLDIRPEHVLVASEVEAMMYYYFSKHQRTLEDNIFFIEGGGRNVSYSCVKDGIIAHDAAYSIAGGGTQLQNLVSKQISQNAGINRPRLELMEQVLSTCSYKQGSDITNVTACVNGAKEEFADGVYSGLLRAIDMAGLQANEISKIVCNGRIFKQVASKGTIISRSVMDILKDKYKSVSSSTIFEYTGTDYPVPEGLVAIRIEEEVQM